MSNNGGFLMPKANVNTASREQLVASGLRAELADEVLKLRRKGRISDVEALGELPGVGPATLEQLRQSLDFGAPEGNGDDRSRDDDRRGGAQPARPMAEAVRGATRAGAEGSETAAISETLQAVQRATKAVSEMERAVAQRSAEGTAELGRLLVELTVAQTRQNLETLKALTEAVDWDQVAKAVNWDRAFQIQGEYLRVNLEQAAQLTRRYLEIGQAVMSAATDTVRDQVQKAA